MDLFLPMFFDMETVVCFYQKNTGNTITVIKFITYGLIPWYYGLSSFEMAGISKYDPTNNIVLCGHDENTKQIGPLQNVCPKPMLEFSERSSMPIQCQSFNNDVTVTPFTVNAESQYWPPSHNYVPHDVSKQMPMGKKELPDCLFRI